MRLPRHIKSKIKELTNYSVCIDCGANIGLVSYIFYTFGAKVYAFEPNPDAFDKLKNLSTSHLNIYPYKSAVGLNDGFSRLFLHNDSAEDKLKYSTGSSMVKSKPNINDLNFIQIKTINLVKFINKFKNIDILKIDIEGFEVELIPFLVKSNILDKVKYIFVETHNDKWPELDNKTKKMIKICSMSKYSEKIFFDWV